MSTNLAKRPLNVMHFLVRTGNYVTEENSQHLLNRYYYSLERRQISFAAFAQDKDKII